MKIGILTFHWGTNYGAVLQAYCLQEYLTNQGHMVEIINYKPKQYDISRWHVFLNPKYWRDISRRLLNEKKERKLEEFRDKFLHRTMRFYAKNDFCDALNKYDVIISGSDQVLNPSFTCHGENGKSSSVYWLSVGRRDSLRIGYAVSFGCEEYPKEAANVAKQWVNNFNVIGTREKTGLQILDQLGYTGRKEIVPDPTLLLGSTLFKNIGIDLHKKQNDYICVYMLRREIKLEGNVRYIDEKHSSLTMEEWLGAIVRSKFLVTNSYHGMIMAILAHVPFLVLLEETCRRGMNDRFFTLLNRLKLEDRIVNNTTIELEKQINDSIDWNEVDILINKLKKEGINFLEIINNESSLV